MKFIDFVSFWSFFGTTTSMRPVYGHQRNSNPIYGNPDGSEGGLRIKTRNRGNARIKPMFNTVRMDEIMHNENAPIAK